MANTAAPTGGAGTGRCLTGWRRSVWFVGPQQPNGQPAATPAAELPAGSLDVPTYRTHPGDPSTGQRQLDFVFASESIADSLTVRALNTEDEWGPSDHCRVLVEITET